MGMFDTIYFAKPYYCPKCRTRIGSTQTKAFEQTLANFHMTDCVSHAEEIRVVKENLFCNKCSEFTGQYVYIAVFRGILVGVADSLIEARHMLNDMNLEKLLLWYHDLYKNYDKNVRENECMLRFMRNVVEWFEQGRHDKKKGKKAGIDDIAFLFDGEYLKRAKDPLDAIKRFLTARQKEKNERDTFE
ncbi:MAG: hypothetical protein C4560_13150 [Nitrospiraceae bacterium]|nr:MAG: hypothetical protein C4560_13150 [Nitrospiraceae bacterium]